MKIGRKSKLKLTKTAIWVGGGLMLGASVGTGIGFLVVTLHNNSYVPTSFGQIVASSTNDPNNDYVPQIIEYDTGVKESASVFGDKIIKIKDADGNDTNIVDLGLKTLAYKIKTRLGYGPEIKQLKKIVISGTGAWAEANGVYFGATNEIFINSKAILANVDQADKAQTEEGQGSNFGFTPEERIEYTAEMIFQVLAHEYNHHMAYTYLNSRFNEGNNHNYFAANPITVDEKSQNTNGSKISDKEAWDADFYDTFTSQLNYDGSDVAKTSLYLNSPTRPYEDSEGNLYTSISSQFSASDLFSYANDDNVTKVSRGLNTWDDSKHNYALWKSSQPVFGYKQSDLLYYYSLAELYARKIQQSMMPLGLFYDEGYPLASFRNKPVGTVAGASVDEGRVFGLDQMMKNTKNVISTSSGTEVAIRYSPFVVDTKNYADARWSSNTSDPITVKIDDMTPFLSDYLYNGNDNTNAYKIYDSILNEMGYFGANVKDATGSEVAEEADIAKIWWQNTSNVDPEGKFAVPEQNSNFNMGGYIDKDGSAYSSIGYLDANGKYIPLSDISISQFTYNVKKTLGAGDRDFDYNKGKDQYFWTLKDYTDITKFLNKPLVFLKTADQIAIEKLDMQVALYLKNTKQNASSFDQAATEKLRDDIKNKNLANLNITDNDWQTWGMDKLEPLPYKALTSYNSEANTWLSQDAPASVYASNTIFGGLNSQIARPTYMAGGIGIKKETPTGAVAKAKSSFDLGGKVLYKAEPA